MRSLLQALGDGLQASELSVGQVLARAVIIFVTMLVMVRVAHKRFLAKRTAFDFALGIMLGSMMARAINGPERLVPTIGGGFLIVGLHSLLGRLACWSPRLGGWFKGHSQTLVENGRVDESALHRHQFADDDLEEELRLHGLSGAEEVKLARLERSGSISVIKKSA